MVLPFRPLNLAFSHMYYSVDLPPVSNSTLLMISLCSAVINCVRLLPVDYVHVLASGGCPAAGTKHPLRVIMLTRGECHSVSAGLGGVRGGIDLKRSSC